MKLVANVACIALLGLGALGGVSCGEPDVAPPVHTGVCDGVITEVATIASPHVDSGADEVWTSNPPTSGPHSPAWAGWDRHHVDLERAHWVHNLEHGGVVLAYRCDEACPDVVAALIALASAVDDDPICNAPVRHRLLVAADPLLPDGVQVAAVAWGVHYTASCLDEDTLRAFIAERYDDAPEHVCADGLPFTGEPI